MHSVCGFCFCFCFCMNDVVRLVRCVMMMWWKWLEMEQDEWKIRNEWNNGILCILCMYNSNGIVYSNIYFITEDILKLGIMFSIHDNVPICYRFSIILFCRRLPRRCHGQYQHPCYCHENGILEQKSVLTINWGASWICWRNYISSRKLTFFLLVLNKLKSFDIFSLCHS